MGDRLREGRGIAPEVLGRHAQLLVAASDNHLRAERTAQHVDRLPQRRPRMGLILLGPEQPQQRVTAVVSDQRRDSEVREQRDTLGLREHGANLPAVASDETDRSKSSEFQHARSPAGLPGNAQVTLNQLFVPIV